MIKRYTPQEILDWFKLEPLVREGGMFRSVYQSKYKLEDCDICNAIYLLLNNDAFSHLHRLQSDEIYHHYYGDPLELLELFPDGTSRVVVLGQNYAEGQVPQTVMHGGSWHGSRVLPGGEYTFVGTSMSPGFVEGGYEHADRDELIRLYPDRKEMIEALTGEVKYF